MTKKSEQLRITEWAENIQNTDPAWWERLVDTSTRHTSDGTVADRLKAEESAIRRLIAMCNINKERIPKEYEWSGKDRAKDLQCRRCEVLETGGKLRYLGHHYFGTIKTAKVWWDEDVEVSGDVDVPYWLNCWRCNICGNERTEDY